MNCLVVQHSKRLIYIPGGCLTPVSLLRFLNSRLIHWTFQRGSVFPQFSWNPPSWGWDQGHSLDVGFGVLKHPTCHGETRMSWSCQLIVGKEGGLGSFIRSSEFKLSLGWVHMEFCNLLAQVLEPQSGPQASLPITSLYPRWGDPRPLPSRGGEPSPQQSLGRFLPPAYLLCHLPLHGKQSQD